MRVPPFKKTITPSIRSTLVKSLHTSATNPPPLPSSKAFDSYVSLLRRCAAEKSIVEARRVHLHMKKTGFPYLSLGNKLVDAYLKCGAIDDAREVFDEMPKPHIVLWNAMISFYARCRRSKEAIFLFQTMLSRGIVADEFTFSSILRAFSDLCLVAEGRGAHGRLVKTGGGGTAPAIGQRRTEAENKGDRRRSAESKPRERGKGVKGPGGGTFSETMEGEGGGGDGGRREEAEEEPRDARVVKELLRSMGVGEGEYEPRIVLQFLELGYRYVVDVLSDAQIYAEHAGKSAIDPDDVRLAIQSKVNFSFSQPPPREVTLLSQNP